MVSQKIQATASKKGFTLVELIVVITILAILGTIGFISIQGYSAQSRDSKRTSDLRSLASALTIKATDGIALTSFVTPVSSSTIQAATGANAHVGGKQLTGSLADYSAGTPNFTALGVSSANFMDGTNNYRIGTSTRNGGVFQVAARMEASGTPTALTSGNYSARTLTGNFAMSGSNTNGNIYSISNLPTTAIGFFNKDDIVNVAALNYAGLGTITAVNGDGRGFSVQLPNSTTTFSNTGTVALGNAGGWAEAPGLIAAVGTPTIAVANGSGATLPY